LSFGIILKKILIFGNSASGKSTKAKQLVVNGLAHLDLDTIAWNEGSPPVRKPIEQSKSIIDDFTNRHHNWVIEGCYADLIKLLLPIANEVIFMNLPIEDCIKNAKSRPWEPHKYPSKKAQDDNLEMLIEWIRQYAIRTDTFSQQAHRDCYDRFKGKKSIIDSNH